MKPDPDFAPQPVKKNLSYRAMMIIGFSIAFAVFTLSYNLVFSPGFNVNEMVYLPDESLPLGAIAPGESLALCVNGSEDGSTVQIDASESHNISASVCIGKLGISNGLRLELKYTGGITVSAASCSFESAIIMLNNEETLLVIDSSYLTDGLSFNVWLQFRLDPSKEEAVFDCKLYNGDSDIAILSDQITVKADR